MKHSVMTDEEIAAAALMQEGVYDFEIIEATEAKSKSGNDMFKLKLNVFDTEGKPRVIMDWVLPDFPKKYKHLHDACGLLDLYKSGETKPGDLIGKAGKLSIGIGKPYIGNDGFEHVNNTVLDYVKKDNMVEGAKPLPKDVLGDEVPF